MNTIVVLLILVAVVVVVVLFLQGRIGPRRFPNAAAREQNLGPDLNLGTLRPGDVVGFWSGKESLVERVVECQETLPGRVSRWRWAFLEGGQLLSLAQGANVLYTDSTVIRQGSEPFERLTGDADRGGVLKTFEQRVRDNESGSNPVSFDYEGQSYRVQSTGTFAVPDQPVPDGEVWGDVQADEGQNVYFRLVGPEDTYILGIWTSHILLLNGKPVKSADLREIYRAQTR